MSNFYKISAFLSRPKKFGAGLCGFEKSGLITKLLFQCLCIADGISVDVVVEVGEDGLFTFDVVG